MDSVVYSLPLVENGPIVMDSVQEILADPEIARYLETHQGAADEIQSAAKELSDKPDAIPALRKLLPALGRKALPIFFSYKTKDGAAAKKIVELLRKNSAEKLDIRYQGDFAKAVGEEWRKLIRDAIDRANWFILLLPDPSEDLDWCLYETGIFEAQQRSGDRLICIHHPLTEVPDQINIYQAVAAEVDKVEAFLRTVYLENNPIPGMKPINKAVADDIGRLAQEIVDAILPPREKYHPQIFEPWMKLTKPEDVSLEQIEDIDELVIEDANQSALDLFGFIDQPKTFGRLRDGVIEVMNGRWRQELFEMIRCVTGGRRWSPVQAVFQTETGKLYRPVLHAVDRLGGRDGRIVNYQITFTEDISAFDTSGIPRDLFQLATLLRFAFRFRWEILEKFTTGTLTEDDVERVNNAFERMQVEWESRGAGREIDFSIFPNKKTRDRVTEMTRDFASMRNPDKTGELDVAIEQKDAKKVQELLRSLIPVNQEFLELTTDAFSDIIHES